jgi:hypothetical protein
MSESDERATMVHALREEPGSYVSMLEDGSEVIYTIRPSDRGFFAEWEYVADSGEGPARSQGEEFFSYADTLRHLEDSFAEPLTDRRP